MDPLSELLDTLSASTAVAVCFRFSEPFAISKGRVLGVPFRIGEGRPYWLRIEGESWVRIEPGDLVLLPHGDPHVIASDRHSSATPMSSVLASLGVPEWVSSQDELPCIVEVRWGGQGAATTVVAGILSFHDFAHNPVLESLPRLIHVRAAESTMVPRLASTLLALLDEFTETAPGWSYTVCRMAEVILAQALRAHFELGATKPPGWFRAVSDPEISRSIILLHREFAIPWTVASLAKTVGMSRTRFASRFTLLLGNTPMGYLAHVRFAHAANRLARGDDVIKTAVAVGYGSEKAFSRAFRRWAGVPPGRYGRARRISSGLEGAG